MKKRFEKISPYKNRSILPSYFEKRYVWEPIQR
ncbi:hypothetical protein LSS_21395 [Leptospira santarosai serovar Shermani str. LT 821]|uniref:Uncharacterized protein n=1 Tax=Leptospira santarosai serovar Shermani str. LT 821 TaxID=758847 RepID=A0A097ESG0_9LEPT|nr:hypothetical protein LSS_21395 [Leptospira santarosai serovar Shermani str. LT 821]